MARLLRLHLSCVGHKDARFFPLTLDFRNREGDPTECVVWLMNGGGKSSLMNLFYSTFLPESRKFLGSSAETGERKLADYVKAADLAVIVSEWQMPAGAQLFSTTRIVGQILAWRGGIATANDETRLEREFFTFRPNVRVPFESLPFYGLNPQPLSSISKVREWLTYIGSECPELELERGDQNNKRRWRETLDRVGIDTELFTYHLKMNVREGGAAELFKVRTTMEFVDLFLEMALNPDRADRTSEQIEAVREKLLRLPQKELEERFAIGLLEQLRPLSSEASTANAAEVAWRDQRQRNFFLRSAIETSIDATQSQILHIGNELELLRQNRASTVKEKAVHERYRLNYNDLARELTFLEAKQDAESARERLHQASLAQKVAAAGTHFARISSHQRELSELCRTRDMQLAEQKPVLDELHALGAAYAAALDADRGRLAELVEAANLTLSGATGAHADATAGLNALQERQTRINTQLESLEDRLKQRDQRRAILIRDGHLMAEETAVDAIVRWETVRERIDTDILAAEVRIEDIGKELDDVASRIFDLDLRIVDRRNTADEKDRSYQRGRDAAQALCQSIPIQEILRADLPDLDFPDLLSLLHSRQHQLDEALIQSRLDRVDDERTLHNLDLDRLFPPSREVELVLAHLRKLGLTTALPAYRYLATNAPIGATARMWLAKEPARFSGVVVTSEDEFQALQADAFVVPGLRHPVEVTLSANPDEAALTNDKTVALPASDGAFNYETAANEQRDIEDRLEKSDEQIASIVSRRTETAEVVKELSRWQIEFGRGALARLLQERDQVRAEGETLTGDVASLRSLDTALRREREDKQSKLKELRPEIVVCTQRIERLQSYFHEYEQYETQWEAGRQEKIAVLEHLAGEIAAQEHVIRELGEEVDRSKERLGHLKREHQKRTTEREAIRFKDASVPVEALMLETTETRYRSALERYEERFGRSELDGRIKQAELHLTELRNEHEQLSAGLSEEDVAAAALHPDLRGRCDTATREHLVAHSIHDAAVAKLTLAERNRPRGHVQGEAFILPANQPVPTTAAEAIVQRDVLAGIIEAATETIAKLDAQISEKEREHQRLEGSINARTPHLATLEDLTETGIGSTPVLPTNDNLLADMVAVAKRQTLALFKSYEGARRIVDHRIEQLHQVSRDKKFASIPQVARDRLSALSREELVQRCNEFVQSHEAWQKVLRNEIDTLDQDKDLVVRALDGIATSAVRLLGKAERASIMSDAFPGWTGQPFLRITTHPITEPAARRDRLATLVGRLVNEKAIPTGHALASAALREIGGEIRATLLKPEDPLRPDRYDITQFGTFSGGEKMTAAVLLYATLAQLRIRGRDERTRDREAGVLLLDNPFGTASKREFVELQLRVARQMSVQLIYTTGVNDLGALDVLPKILRLRKRHRDRRTGDLLLSQQAAEEHVEGVEANLRR